MPGVLQSGRGSLWACKIGRLKMKSIEIRIFLVQGTHASVSIVPVLITLLVGR